MSHPRWPAIRRTIVEDTEFINQCLQFWDRRYDTKDIARELLQPEHVVQVAIRLGRERRREKEGTGHG